MAGGCFSKCARPSPGVVLEYIFILYVYTNKELCKESRKKSSISNLTQKCIFGATMLERMDLDLTVCKAEIASLETQATHHEVRMEQMQHELRILKEGRDRMD